MNSERQNRKNRTRQLNKEGKHVMVLCTAHHSRSCFSCSLSKKYIPFSDFVNLGLFIQIKMNSTILRVKLYRKGFQYKISIRHEVFCLAGRVFLGNISHVFHDLPYGCLLVVRAFL